MKTIESDEFFGSPEQVALMQRGQNLWALVKDNPAYSFYGRMVSLCEPGKDSVGKMIALAKLQGAASCQYYPVSDADRFCLELETHGIRPSRYEQCRGKESALAASKRILEQYQLPDDLTVVSLDKSSSTQLVSDVAELSLSCGVMPVPGSAMRRISQEGICLAAVDASGKPVATASSYLSNHRESPKAKDVFWGMLATQEDRRGQRLGQILGAKSIIWMWENLGARSFNTGITANNASSMALCAKLGVTPSKWTFIACMDPATFGESSMTR